MLCLDKLVQRELKQRHSDSLCEKEAPRARHRTIEISNFGLLRRHHWKERLKIWNISYLKVWCLKPVKIYNASKFADVCMGRRAASLCPPPPKKMSVKFLPPLWGAKTSLVFSKSLSNLAILSIIILRRYFQWCQLIFPINLSKSKVVKNLGKVYSYHLVTQLALAIESRCFQLGVEVPRPSINVLMFWVNLGSWENAHLLLP